MRNYGGVTRSRGPVCAQLFMARQDSLPLLLIQSTESLSVWGPKFFAIRAPSFSPATTITSLVCSTRRFTRYGRVAWEHNYVKWRADSVTLQPRLLRPFHSLWPLGQRVKAAQFVRAIEAAARELNTLRVGWLNPLGQLTRILSCAPSPTSTTLAQLGSPRPTNDWTARYWTLTAGPLTSRTKTFWRIYST